MTRARSLVFAFLLALVPVVATAQSSTSGAIAGVVKDATGAVLPGVTAEAASPALIEKVRTVTTDGEGNYRIVDLRPGIYTVTFALPGFGSVKREGVELTSGFTASINAELKVGDVSETITVTGASPVVDVQNSRTQTVLSSELLNATPTGNKNPYTFAALTVGAVAAAVTGQDVGGSLGEVGGAIAYHGVGGGDSKLKIDGMDYNALVGQGGGPQRLYVPNTASVAEVNLGLGTGDAEHATAGVQMNYVPKEGSNRFSLTGLVAYSDENMQGDNINDTIRARGLSDSGGVLKSWDNGLAVGGPIKQDKVWFFVAPRFWGNRNRNPGAFYNLTQHTPFYTPDRDHPADSDLWQRDLAARVTWQLTSKNKVTFSHNEQRSCYCTYVASATLAPEAFVSYTYKPSLTQATWTMPATNRLLLQAGISYGRMRMSSIPTGDVLPTDIAKTDAGTGVTYGAVATINFGSNLPYADGTKSDPLYGRFAASYVTGSHSFKLGLQTLEGFNEQFGRINQDLFYIFFNRSPIQLQQFATPLQKKERARGISLYGQDQWTISRLTLNVGVRFDSFKGWVPENVVPAGRFVPERRYAAVSNIPNYKDITPRIGAAYDVFGNGKTALKLAWGMYVSSQGIGTTELNNPAFLTVTSASRTWNDNTFPVGDPRRGNFEPDCVLTTFTANGECGAINNNLFGTSVAGTRFDDGVIRGWGNRSQATQMQASVQQELRPGWSVTAGYFRTHYSNINASVNTAVSATDFTSYCVNAPADARLPGGGGYQVCGNVDVIPARFGQVSTLVQMAEDLGVGDVTRVFNGVDVSTSGRFGKGGVLSGGVSVGRTVRDDCALKATPQALSTGQAWDGPGRRPLSDAYCHIAPTLSASTSFKLNGVYPLPYGFEASAVLQNLPGITYGANLMYTNAQVAPALGRNLSAGAAGTVSIPIIAPETAYEPRLTQVDLRFSRNFRFGRTRVKGNLDLYNVFNESAITTVNQTFGARWREPQKVMFGRLMKIGGQFDF